MEPPSHICGPPGAKRPVLLLQVNEISPELCFELFKPSNPTTKILTNVGIKIYVLAKISINPFMGDIYSVTTAYKTCTYCYSRFVKGII